MTARGLAAIAALLAAAALATACVPPGSVSRASYTTIENTPAAGATAAPSPAAATAAPDTGPATILRVVDGDTLDVRVPGGEVKRVRLVHVDAPEDGARRECHGPEATAFVRKLLPPRTLVHLERDYTNSGPHGRLLRYVRLQDGSLLSVRLAAAGMAEYRLYRPATDTLHADLVEAAEAEARSAGRGLWGAC